MISQEIKEIYAGSNVNRPIDTLHFKHSLFSQEWFFVNDHQNWIFKIEDGTSRQFMSMPFAMQLPSKDSEGRQDLQIAMSNIGRIMSDEMELANANPRENIECIYRVYLDVMDDSPQIVPSMQLWISEVFVDPYQISAVATRFDVLNRVFPNRFFRDWEYPGLLR